MVTLGLKRGWVLQTTRNVRVPQGGGEGVLRKGQRAGEEEVSVLNAGNSSWADLLSGDESRQPGLWALPITLPQ